MEVYVKLETFEEKFKLWVIYRVLLMDSKQKLKFFIKKAKEF